MQHNTEYIFPQLLEANIIVQNAIQFISQKCFTLGIWIHLPFSLITTPQPICLSVYLNSAGITKQRWHQYLNNSLPEKGTADLAVTISLRVLLSCPLLSFYKRLIGALGPAASLRAPTPPPRLPLEDPSEPADEGEAPACWTITERACSHTGQLSEKWAIETSCTLSPSASYLPWGVKWMFLRWAVFVYICLAEHLKDNFMSSCFLATLKPEGACNITERHASV